MAHRRAICFAVAFAAVAALAAFALWLDRDAAVVSIVAAGLYGACSRYDRKRGELDSGSTGHATIRPARRLQLPEAAQAPKAEEAPKQRNRERDAV